MPVHRLRASVFLYWSILTRFHSSEMKHLKKQYVFVKVELKLQIRKLERTEKVPPSAICQQFIFAHNVKNIYRKVIKIGSSDLWNPGRASAAILPHPSAIQQLKGGWISRVMWSPLFQDCSGMHAMCVDRTGWKIHQEGGQ